MQQQASPSPVVDRALPTRPAAVALLALDAVLLVAPFIVQWQSWFVFVYIPLLSTVVWGLVLGGIWKWPAIVLFSAPLMILVTVRIALVLPGGNLDRLGYVTVGGQAILAGVGVVVVALALRGWVRFFGRRAAA